MKKLKIAIDLDGVLFDIFNPFLNYYNQKHGTNFSVEGLNTHHFPKFLGISGPEARKEWDNFYEQPSFKTLGLMPDATHAVSELSKKYSLAVVTSRPDFTAPITLNSLKTHFTNLFSDVHFTNHFGGNGKESSKSAYCITHGYDVLVEDIPDFANECAAAGIKVFLITRKWNEDAELHPKVTRVNSWLEILENLK